ncbi:MAG: hypothetical protein J1E34_00765 [Oscillospiraceae bacterium]|nr:hypothetical protein [Oscillospiraceae bacterium]
MAQYCPKCNYKLKVTDWKPDCPKCGVNVLYYGIEESLRKEADIAEYNYAKRKPKFDRLKFSLIGHPLSIVRIVLGLLPLVALLLPMGKISFVLPFGEHSATANLVSIITFFVKNGFDLDALTALFGSELLGKAIICFSVALVGLALMAILTLVGFFLLTLSCSPKGMKRNIGFPIVGIVLATVSFVGYCLMISSLNSAIPDVFSGSVNPLAYIAVCALFIAMIVVNIIYKKKNIPVKYTDVSELLLPYDERPSTIEKKKNAVSEAKTE